LETGRNGALQMTKQYPCRHKDDRRDVCLVKSQSEALRHDTR
jgi:hypothetical protein